MLTQIDEILDPISQMSDVRFWVDVKSEREDNLFSLVSLSIAKKFLRFDWICAVVKTEVVRMRN